MKIKRNIIEFGILILSLFGDFDIRKLYRDFKYRKFCLEKIYGQIARSFREFFSYIFDSQLAPKSFLELLNWFKKHKKIFLNDPTKSFYYKDPNLKKEKKSVDKKAKSKKKIKKKNVTIFENDQSSSKLLKKNLKKKSNKKISKINQNENKAN